MQNRLMNLWQISVQYLKNFWASITNVLDAISEVSRASNDGAEATTEIADKSANVLRKADVVIEEAKKADAESNQMRDSVEKFIVS